MDPITLNVLAVVLGAITGLVTALGTWSHQRKKLDEDARQAVGAAWTALCNEQQERIEQLQNHIERLQARVEKMQTIAESLQDRVIALETENADLRIDMKRRDARIAALESENSCLRGAK